MTSSIPGHHGTSTDAYRLFFPLGVALGIAGVSIWPLYHWGITQSYSGLAHAFIQTNCFLYAFIVGFLWTAVPRFTGTAVPGWPIQLLMAALLVAETVALELYKFSTAHLLFAAAHTIFAAVLMSRFIKRRQPPPETFALVGIGVLTGLLAAAINVSSALGIVAPTWDLLGRRLLSEGMILLLVLGVGGFLGPRLLGFAQLPDLQSIGRLRAGGVPGSLNANVRFSAVCGFVLVATVILQYGWGHSAGRAWLEAGAGFLKAGVATVVIVRNIHPWRFPVVRSTLSWCVWIAHWFLIAALWLVAAVPNDRISYLHVMFMGAFTLLILAVGTRVVLSHGGHSLNEESRSWPLRLAISASIVGMSARLFAMSAASPESYSGHLAWAAVLWISGMSIWGIYLLARITFSRRGTAA